MCTDGDEAFVRFDPSTITAETCLAMNRAYQEVLLDTLRQVEISLTENRAKQVACSAGNKLCCIKLSTVNSVHNNAELTSVIIATSKRKKKSVLGGNWKFYCNKLNITSCDIITR